jgi:hypothetical protein
MNDEELRNEALKRQKLLESMFSKVDLEELQEFNPKLAQSSMSAAKLRESIMEPLKPLASKTSPNTAGYVYILKNSFIPGFVKIGCADRDPIESSLELSVFCGNLGRFEVVFSCHILNVNVVEKKLQSELSIYRRDDELFELDADLAQLKIKDLLASWGLI